MMRRRWPFCSKPFNSYRISPYLWLTRVEEADAPGKEAHAQGLDSRLAPVLYGTAFYRDDTSEIARQPASATGKADDGELLLAMQADTAAYFGHLRKAREFSRQAADSDLHPGPNQTAAAYHTLLP